MAQTFNDAGSRAVVAADTADAIGEVKGFVVDPTASRIECIHVAGRGRRAAWTTSCSTPKPER